LTNNILRPVPGVDDVFVFVNIFRQATEHRTTRARVLYTVKTAGKATFFTSFTTAAAFAANIASLVGLPRFLKDPLGINHILSAFAVIFFLLLKYM
jgi:predicted RND superfamily exporter protein